MAERRLSLGEAIDILRVMIASLLVVVALVTLLVECVRLATKVSRAARSFPPGSPGPSSQAIWGFFMIPYLIIAFAATVIWALARSGTLTATVCWVLANLTALMIGGCMITSVRQGVWSWARDWRRSKGNRLIFTGVLRQARRLA